MKSRVLIGLGLVLWAASAGAVVRSHPVPVRIEQGVVPSTLHLRFDLQPYGLALEDFLGRTPGDEVEQAFARLMRGLRGGDAAAVAAVLSRNDLGGHPVDAVVAAWRQAFGNFSGVTVVGRVPMGARTLLLWEAETAKGPWLRGFAFERVGAGLKATMVNSNLAVETLVVHALDRARREPSAYFAKDAPQGTHAVTLVPGVTLELHAQPHDFDATTQSPPSDPRLAGFAAAFQLLKAGAVDAFAALLPEASRKQFLDWRAQRPEEVEGWRQYVSLGLRVRLLVEAGDDLALVFFAEGPPDQAPTRLVRWQWMVRAEGRWVPASLHRGGHLETVLERAALPRAEDAFVAAVAAARRP